jgi:hypothetical protein
VSLESFYQQYPAEDLAIVLVNYQDEDMSSDEQALMDYSCKEVHDYGFTFVYYAIDPGNNPFTDAYHGLLVPVNMVLDDDMVIRYRLGSYDPDSLRSTVSTLMQE